MSLSPALHEHVAPGHVVQLYGNDSHTLILNASRYLADALKRGDGALVIATPQLRSAIYQKLWNLDVSPLQAEQEQRLLLVDAGKTLSQFMVAGQPDWDRFESVVGGIIERIHSRNPGMGGSAFGEMVAMLWKTERRSEAICLEGYWNRLLQSNGFSLFCGYPVDVFANDFHSEEMDAVLCAHSHLLPTNDKLESVLHRAMDEVLGPLGLQIRDLFQRQEKTTPSLPSGEGLVRWLRTQMPEESVEILKRARRDFHDSQRNS
jgi:MEDS: MEthanogen/methylotroph, DcmR Sensory domain